MAAGVHRHVNQTSTDGGARSLAPTSVGVVDVVAIAVDQSDGGDSLVLKAGALNHVRRFGVSADRLENDDPRTQMLDMICGYWVSQSIRACADLSLADHLADGPLTAAQVAARERSAPDTTMRLMRAATTLGLLTVDTEQRFHTTALLDTLRSGAPGSMRDVALALTARSHWLPWADFAASVREGRSHGEDALGMPVFDYLKQHPAHAQQFTNAMQSLTALWTVDLASKIDTSEVAVAVDVGGANGSLLRLLQQANPELRGIVFDRPGVAAAVAADVNDERTEVLGGDFFESVPPADLYLLKAILHDWDDESCVRILSRCRQAMKPDGRIAIVEMLVPVEGDPGLTAMVDLNMLAVTGSRERTLAEFDTLLTDAGLRRAAVHFADSPQSLVEAIPE
jgi:SAM-dependent methyltransferase